MRVLLLALALLCGLAAHGPLHEQIAAVTSEIAGRPRDARLYLKRAELRRLHEDWDLAKSDYDRAEALEPTLIEVELGRGRLALDSGRPAAALPHLDRFLAARPDHVDALTQRAEARLAAGNPRGAAADSTRAISLSARPEVELYLLRARAQKAAADHEAALAGLDEGMARLGPLVTLEQAAIESELVLSRYDRALARLARMAAQSPRKESYLVRRGEILQQAGRNDEARAAFDEALRLIDALPPHLKRTKAVAGLAERARAAAAR
jgi:tetratricopeptide (TPR) repeat protein